MFDGNKVRDTREGRWEMPRDGAKANKRCRQAEVRCRQGLILFHPIVRGATIVVSGLCGMNAPKVQKRDTAVPGSSSAMKARYPFWVIAQAQRYWNAKRGHSQTN